MNINATNKKLKIQEDNILMSPINKIKEYDLNDKYNKSKTLMVWYMKFLIKFMELKKIFDNIFGDKWILTGSVAILLLLLNEKNVELLIINDFKPTDIDILVNSLDNVTIKNINNYYRKQTGLEKSVTFINDNESLIKSIDVTYIDKYNYIIENDIRILEPKDLLKYYESEKEEKWRYNKNDNIKILLLNKYINDNLQINSFKLNAKTESKKKLDNLLSNKKLNYNILNKDTDSNIQNKLNYKLILNKDTNDTISKKLLFDDE